MDKRLTRGQAGEDLARQYLERQGLRFREGGFRVPGSEIDLVMEDRGCGELVFVEVRTWQEGAFGHAVSSLTAHKRRALERGIRTYIARAAWEGRYRLDVVTITIRGGTEPVFDHIPYVSLA